MMTSVHVACLSVDSYRACLNWSHLYIAHRGHMFEYNRVGLNLGKNV